MHHTQPHLTQSEIGRPRHAVPASRLLQQLPQPRPTAPRAGERRGSQPELNPPDGWSVERRSGELVHDARNLISALDLYCQLLASPGVLAPGFGCYAEDLRRLADSSARLIEALAATSSGLPSRRTPEGIREIDDLLLAQRPFPPINDLASELEALQGPLQALAGPDVRLEIESMPCAGRLALNAEDLLRILFNLVANAVEAFAFLPVELRRRPLLRITVQRGGAASFLEPAASFLPRAHQLDGQTVLISVRDNGPGIDARHLAHIFDAGFSTRPRESRRTGDAADGSNPVDEAPRGLGLAIVHRLVAAAGGAVRAVSPSGLGARFDIELPILQPEAKATRLELAPSPEKGKISDLQQISAQIEKEA